MRIVGVHGVGNFRTGESARQAADHLSGIWRTAIAAHGLAEPEITVAYYADLLRGSGRQGAGDGLDDLDPFEFELVTSWLAQMSVPEGVAAGPGTWPIRQAIAWVAQTHVPGRAGTEWFVATFFREVAAFLRAENNPERLAVRERVADAIAGDHAEIVIAHSLGSVVAYETLWAYPELDVDLLITLGSPLAMPHAIFPRLRPAPVDQRGARPPNVRRWVNLADPGDIVAIPPGGILRRFEGVDLDRESTIHPFDFHRVRDYLTTALLGTLLSDFTRSS